MTRRQQLPPTVDLVRFLTGKVWHHAIGDLRRTTAEARCGRTGEILDVYRDVDANAIRVAGRLVCGSCQRDRRRSPVRAVDVHAGDGDSRANPGHPAKTERTTMTKAERLEKLRAERLTLNNRMSGTKTQLKRLGNRRDEKTVARRAELKARLDALVARRDEINAKLAELDSGPARSSTTTPEPAPSSEPETPAEPATEPETPAEPESTETPAEALAERVATSSGRKRRSAKTAAA